MNTLKNEKRKEKSLGGNGKWAGHVPGFLPSILSFCFGLIISFF